MLKVLAKFLKPYWLYISLAFAGALGESVANLLQPWPLKVLVDNIFGHKPMNALLRGPASLFGYGKWQTLEFVLCAVFTIACVSAASSFLQDFCMPRVGHWVMHDLRRQLYWHIQRLSLSYHDEGRVGELISTLTSDIQTVRELVESALIGLCVNCMTLLGMVCVMVAVDWRLALLALSTAPLLFGVVYRFTRKMKSASRDARRQEGIVTAVAQEVLTSMRVVQAFTREDYEQGRFERENEQRVNAGIRARTLHAQMKPTIEIIVAAGTVLVFWYGTREVLRGALMPGSLLVFLSYLNGFYKPMKELAKQTDTISRASVAVERITGVLQAEQRTIDAPHATPAPRLRGHIEFDHVSFSYRAGTPVLKDVSFAVQPGQVVALVGTTGAGKTTIVRLLSRFNEPDKGTIRIDGAAIRSYTLASLRSQISLVLQETILFHGTIRDNIAYGRPEATFAEIVNAATLANAHDFIQRLPNGYDSAVGERGVTLSGGQRQLITIARAFVRNAPIVILDEPTSGLDASSEALVMDGLSRLIENRTAIVIAHRLSTIRHADQVLVLEGGEIVESGTPAELQARDGLYARLSSIQLGAYTAP